MACLVAPLGDQAAAALAEWTVRIVANLASGNVWHLFIEQGRQRAQDAALGLPAQTQQDEVLPRENRIHDLRNDGVFKSHDAGKKCLMRLSDERAGSSAFILDAASFKTSFREQCAGAQFPQCLGKRLSCRIEWLLRPDPTV